MWKIFKLLILILSVTYSNCHVAVVGPLVSTGGDTYKAFIATSEYQRNVDLAVVFKCGYDVVRKLYNLGDVGSVVQEVEFKLPKSQFGPCLLLSVLKSGNFCFRDEIHVDNKPNNFIMVQTDKPVYRPNDVVKYQVVVLDSDTKPVPFNEIKIDIFDAKENFVATTKTTDGIRKNFGFYEGEFSIADAPLNGDWTINIAIADLNSTASKTFKVDQYTLPAFKVFIDTQPRLSFHENFLTFNIFAKYSFDRFAKGKANIEVTVRSETNPSEVLSSHSMTEDINSEKNTFKVHLKNDLNINFLVKNVIIVIDVVFVEENTGIEGKGSSQALLFPRGKHIINLDRKEKFRPGFPYKINAEVFTLDGMIEKSTSIPLTIKYKYEYEGSDHGRNADITTVSFLKDGKAQFIFNPPEDAKKIELNYNYDESSLEENVKKVEQSTAEEHLQAMLLTQNPRVGDIINITAQSNSIFEALNIVVIGKNGIVYSTVFKNPSLDVTSANISLVITPEMAPRSDVILFYLRENDGIMIHDQFELNLGFQGNNFLTLNTPREDKKVKDQITIKVSTKPNSLVALLAVDQSVTFMGTNNVISQSLLDLQLSPNSNTYPYKLDNKHGVFGKINAFKISPTSVKRQPCSISDEKLFTQGFIQRGGTFDSKEPKLTSPAGGVQTRREFPEIWFQDVEELSSGNKNLNKILPDSITSWIINGYSINQQDGFAVADQQKVKVFQDFFIKVEKPYTSKRSEVVNVKVVIYNYMKNAAQTSVTLKNARGDFEFFEGQRGSLDKEKTLRTLVQADNTAQVTFKIKPKVAGKIILNIIAKSTKATDAVEDSFFVEASGISKQQTRSVIINVKEPPHTFEDKMFFNITDAVPNTMKFEAVSSSDLLGPALDNVENLVQLAEGCGEQRMRKFASAIMARRYLDETSQTTNKNKRALDKILDKSFQEVMTLQTRNGGFDLWGTSKFSDFFKSMTRKEKDYLDLTAYIVKLLAQYEMIKPLPSETQLNKAMNFIKKQQKLDGRFENDGQPQFRDLKKYSEINGVSLTAYILIGILESDYLKSNYPQVIEKGLKFIDSKFYHVLHDGTNYERALVLYLYVLAEKDHQLMLNKLNEFAVHNDGNVYWEYKPTIPSSPVVQVEIASYVVLALVKLEKYEDAMKIVSFLMTKKNPKGGFESTTDTVLGLQALAEVSKVLYSTDTNIQVTLKNQLDEETHLTVSKTQKRSCTKDLPPNTKYLTVTANGNGVAGFQVSASYKQKIKEFNEYFLLDVTARKTGENLINLEICVKAKRRDGSNMAIMDIKFPSGYKHRYGPNADINEIKEIKPNKEGTSLTIYFESIKTTNICMSDIEAIQYAQVEDLEKSSVTIQDYYEPEKIGINYYNIN